MASSVSSQGDPLSQVIKSLSVLNTSWLLLEVETLIKVGVPCACLGGPGQGEHAIQTNSKNLSPGSTPLPNQKFTIGILLFESVEVLDVCGPFEVFSVAGQTDKSFRVNNYHKTEDFTFSLNRKLRF
jgi:hypothetical protein